MKTYDEIPKRKRVYWDENGGEECWREFGIAGSKVPSFAQAQKSRSR